MKAAGSNDAQRTIRVRDSGSLSLRWELTKAWMGTWLRLPDLETADAHLVEAAPRP